VSYNRPVNTRTGSRRGFLFASEYPMIRWLEANGYDVGIRYVRYLARHPSTAQHLAYKLCLRFVSDDPPQGLVDSLAATYLANDTAIVPVLRKMAGLPPRSDAKVNVTVPVRIASEMGRKEFVLVSLAESGGKTVAFPTQKGSGAVTSFSQADGFIEIAALASGLDADTAAQVTLIGAAARAPDVVIMGSHDVALDVVVGALAERGFSARTIAVGSQGGVTAARRGECDVAPVHLIDPATGAYNRHLLAPGLSLIKGWQRMQGVLFRPGDRTFEGKSAAEAVKAALADPSCIMVNRNAGAGTRVLIDALLAGARPPGYANQPRSHNAVAAAIAQARADWGVAIEPVARLYGLGFLPLAPEEYDFLLVESRRDRPAVQAFLAALRDPGTRERIRALGMQPADG
jgi:putative molybdopterin biosynthesis protein